jgi:hypothetical protein
MPWEPRKSVMQNIAHVLHLTVPPLTYRRLLLEASCFIYICQLQIKPRRLRLCRTTRKYPRRTLAKRAVGRVVIIGLLLRLSRGGLLSCRRFKRLLENQARSGCWLIFVGFDSMLESFLTIRKHFRGIVLHDDKGMWFCL